jgi:hypothetical protein
MALCEHLRFVVAGLTVAGFLLHAASFIVINRIARVPATSRVSSVRKIESGLKDGVVKACILTADCCCKTTGCLITKCAGGVCTPFRRVFQKGVCTASGNIAHFPLHAAILLIFCHSAGGILAQVGKGPRSQNVSTFGAGVSLATVAGCSLNTAQILVITEVA